METSIFNTGNTTLLQQFAVKSGKQIIVYNDRAVTYNRCSKEKQDSIQWQEKITADCVKQNNWVLVRCFGEKESATTDERKEFQEMLKFCIKEKISHIVFYSYCRFSRTGETSLLKELREKGIKIHAATQGLDDETPSGRITQKLYLMFAEMDSEQRREKIIEGLKNKLRKGEWITNPPLGYFKKYVTGEKAHDHDKRQSFINETGRILYQAFYWKDNENLSDNEIVERLKTMGLKLTPKKLRRIFRNPFYCGYITHSLLDEGEMIRGKHEPLIDEVTFLRINGILSRNPHGWKKINHDSEMPLKFSVRCGICDLPLTAYLQKKIYVYYKCRNKGCCVNLASKKLHQLFGDMLSQFTVASELMPAIKSQLGTTYQMLHQSESAREKPMKDELTRLKNELDVMELNHATGKLSLELFEKHSEAHRHKTESIAAELEILGRDTSNLGLYIDRAMHFARNLPEMWQKLDLSGKIRLQKLVYPSGLQYIPENCTLRTLAVNPIFSAITSISNNLIANSSDEAAFNVDKIHQLYLGFPSSNFLWENLEKIAPTSLELYEQTAVVSKSVISSTGETPTFNKFSSTQGLNAIERNHWFSCNDQRLTGSTYRH
ncbi:hypothetical protein BH11BAC1_BH11BAC1_16530 [soil metagenome]